MRSEDVDRAWALVETIRFGSLVSSGDTPLVSHLPFMVDRHRGPQGILIGHMARGNPQWKALVRGERVLATFLGPNTHISPSWYASDPRAPTWNYVAVHLGGRIAVVDDPAALDRMVRRLSREMEPPDSGWTIDGIDPAYVDRLVLGIVGFEIEIDHIETQLRLLQQNDVVDRRRVREALKRGNLLQRQVAEIMDQIFPELTGEEGRERRARRIRPARRYKQAETDRRHGCHRPHDRRSASPRR